MERNAYNNISIVTDGSYRAEQAYELAKALSVYEPGQHVQISCGNEVVEKAAAGNGFKVHISDPQKNYDAFDLVFVPGHDPHPALPNIIETTGLINHISPEYLAGKERDFGLPAPYTAVLIGGRHIGGNIGPEDAEILAAELNKIEGSVLITNSHRTEEAVLPRLKGLLSVPHYIYDFHHDGLAANPYEAILASASNLIVTADSVRMVSEAASSGRPFVIYTPKELHFSYAHLRDSILAADLPLNEAKRCAEIIVNLALAKKEI